MSYSAIYVAHVELFPAQIVTMSLGFCGTFARIFGIFIPFIAELENKSSPLIIVMFMNLSGFLVSFLLKKPN